MESTQSRNYLSLNWEDDVRSQVVKSLVELEAAVNGNSDG